jgi:ribonuclease HII
MLHRRSKHRCTFRFEKKLREQGFTLIAGVDEVGRGALCGPVVAAAVVFRIRPPIRGINDSKLLTPERREKLKPKILKSCVSWGVGVVSAEEIDRLNIYHASLKAMKMALDQLEPPPDFVLIDGRTVKGVFSPNLCLIHGDARCISIAAASIVAKVTRDHLMKSYASMYPVYDWMSNKGYSCPQHFKALREHGPTSFHRRSFRPIYEELQLNLSDNFDESNLDELADSAQAHFMDTTLP